LPYTNTYSYDTAEWFLFHVVLSNSDSSGEESKSTANGNCRGEWLIVDRRHTSP